MSDWSPAAVARNVRVASSTSIVLATAAPDDGRSGVLKYAYSGTVSDSVYSPDGPVSKSNTVIATIASAGNTIVSFI